jgi:hypothetical protein
MRAERGDVMSDADGWGVQCLMLLSGWSQKREFFIVNLLVRIHFIIEIILVDRPCAVGVSISLAGPNLSPGSCHPWVQEARLTESTKI